MDGYMTYLPDEPFLAIIPGPRHAGRIGDKFREPTQFQRCSNECGCDEIIHKESSVVRKEDTPMRKQRDISKGQSWHEGWGKLEHLR